VTCARKEALRGPEYLPAYSCLLQINHNNSYYLFGAFCILFYTFQPRTLSLVCAILQQCAAAAAAAAAG
jgi:hypothetical protein